MLKDDARIAYCGLYCPMCSSAAAAETGDRRHLLAMPRMYDHLKQRTLEVCSCPGCRIQVDKCHCEMKPCAEKKGLISCAECAAFPCETIDAFGQDGAPHHAEALQNLWRIKEVGYEKWLQEMDARMYCECGERQSWYYCCSNHTETM